MQTSSTIQPLHWFFRSATPKPWPWNPTSLTWLHSRKHFPSQTTSFVRCCHEIPLDLCNLSTGKEEALEVNVHCHLSECNLSLASANSCFLQKSTWAASTPCCASLSIMCVFTSKAAFGHFGPAKLGLNTYSWIFPLFCCQWSLPFILKIYFGVQLCFW